MRTKQKTGLAAWKKVYYKQDAKNVSKKNALSHSILKWRGLLKGVLKKFKLHLDGRALFDDDTNRISVDGDTCALCTHYLDFSNNCAYCPLHKLCGCRCDQGRNPYHEFIIGGNALPMLRLLRKAEKQQFKESQIKEEYKAQKKCGRSSTRKD